MSNQKRLRFIAILLAAVNVLFLSSCQPTPQEEIVKNKKEDTFMDSLVSDNTTITNDPFADYARTWEQAVQVKPHNIAVNINANIVLPNSDQLPVYEVLPERITQEQVDGFLSQFGDVEYRLNTSIKTKADYMDMIIEAQQYLAEKEYEKATNDIKAKERLRKETEDSIVRMNQWMQEAPESNDDVIKPVFTNQHLIAQSLDEHFVPGEVEETSDSDHESAQEHYERTHTDAIDIKWEKDNVPMALSIHRSDDLPANNFKFSSGQGNVFSSNVVTNSSDLAGLNTTYEQAKTIAENTLLSLGIDYMSIAFSAKEIEYKNLRSNANYIDKSNFTDFSTLEYSDKDYVFYFTRDINGTNETYCSNGQGYIDQFDQPWPYVKLYIIVNDDGVKEISWLSTGSTLGQKISDNSQLMPFNEIQKIAADQFSIGNIDFSGSSYADDHYEGLVNMNLNINEIVLGYARVKLSDGSGKYVMVPVWDFFGYDESFNNGDPNQQRNEYSKERDAAGNYRHSYLTINAIDGSVIDRGLGY